MTITRSGRAAQALDAAAPPRVPRIRPGPPPAARILLASPQPAFVATGPDLLLWANEAAGPFLPPGAQGAPAAQAWPEARDLLDAAQRGEPAKGTRLLLVSRDGGPLREVQAHFALSPLPGPGAGVLGFLSDRTPDHLSRRRRALLAALAGPTDGGLPGLQARMAQAFARFGQHDLPFALLFLRDRDGRLALAASSGLAAGHPAADPAAWPLEALHGPHDLLLRDALPPGDYPTGPWPHPPGAAALVPVPGGAGGAAGVLVAGLSPVLALDEALRDLLRLVAAQLGGAAAAARSAEAAAVLHAAAERSAFLAGLGDALRNLSDPALVMREAARRLGRHLGLARAGFVENDLAAGTGQVSADWTSGRMPSAAGTHDLAGYGAAVVARLRAGETVVLSDADSDPSLAPWEAADYAARGGIRAALGVPLLKGGDWVATLFLHDDRPRHWTPEQVDLAREVAERSWSALEAACAIRTLHEREAFTRGVLDASSDCIKVTDLEGRLLFMSAGGLRSMEIDDFASIAGTSWPSHWPEDQRPKVEAALARARSGEVGSFRGALPSTRGHLRHWDALVTPIPGEDGRPERLLVVSRDTTAQRRAEGALRESDRRFRAMADSAPVLVWTTDAEGRCTYINRRWSDMTGRAPAEALDRSYRAALHPDDRDAMVSAFRAATRDQAPVRTEYRLRRGDGTYAHVIDEALPRFDATGAFLGHVGSVTDITELREAEGRRALLVNELNHRVKNTLATVQSLAAQSFRLGQVDAAVRSAFEARLLALSRAHDVLTQGSWEGASLPEVARRALSAFGEGEDRISLRGAPVRLPPRMVLALAMALHELATNAAKYGALSNATGRVDLHWSIVAADGSRRLRLTWTEAGGPPVVPPRRRGFGSRLIENGLAAELDGEVAMDYPPSGVICRLIAPLPGERLG